MLVADDDEDIRETLTTYLESQGWEVHAVEGGQSALRFLREHAYEAVLTDERMDEVSGTEVLAYTQAASPGTRRVLMSAYPEASFGPGTTGAGAYVFLPKPLNLRLLRAALGMAER